MRVLGSIVCGLVVVGSLAIVAPNMGLKDWQWWLATMLMNIGYPIGQLIKGE